MAVTARSYKLNVFCKKHPDYRARRKSGCPSCALIFILRHQHTETAGDYLGGLNPYQFIGDLERACEDIEVREENSPSALEFTRPRTTQPA